MMTAPAATLVDVIAPLEQEGTRASVRSWHRQVGEFVAEGEPLIELETDKVAVEVVAPISGVVAAILVSDGADAERGAVLGRLQPAADAAGASATAGAAAGPAHAAAVGADAPAGTATGLAPSPRALAGFDPALGLSPSVRRLLVASGLDPHGLVGTGRGGRLTAADVEREVARQRAMPQRPASAPSAPVVPSGRRVPHDSMRRRIAEHMVRSVSTAPHVTSTFEVDLGAVLAHRDAHRAALEAQGVHLTLTAYFVRAAADALRHVPAVNSRWHDDALEIFDEVHIGVGTALGERGLIVPVVHDAHRLALGETAARLQDLTARARAGTLTPVDVSGGTFTISNHGVSGSLTAAPIVINQPQSAILGIGRLEKRVVVRQVAGSDAMVIRPMSYVTLTIDHRAIDGAQANAWLTRFVEVLEGWSA